MSTFADAIDAIISRLENWTPERDPKAKFRHADHGPSQHDREFIIVPEMRMERPSGNQGAPYVVSMSLDFHYPSRTDRVKVLKNVGDDYHELHDRLGYFPGSEWNSSFNCRVDGARISKSLTDGITLTVDLSIVYNVD